MSVVQVIVCVGDVCWVCAWEVCVCVRVCVFACACVCTIVCTGIEQSFKDGCWADESSFEVKGAATLSNVYVTEAPRRARENRALLVRASCLSPALASFLWCCSSRQSG